MAVECTNQKIITKCLTLQSPSSFSLGECEFRLQCVVVAIRVMICVVSECDPATTATIAFIQYQTELTLFHWILLVCVRVCTYGLCGACNYYGLVYQFSKFTIPCQCVGHCRVSFSTAIHITSDVHIFSMPGFTDGGKLCRKTSETVCIA